jgi:23S rRNA pseudouridine2605 synthase
MSKKDESTRRPLSLKAKAAPETTAAPRIEERLHKVLAQAGLGSRRALEQRIADGLVKVNGEVARTGMSITGGDKIELDGKTFVASALVDAPRVLIYNKPESEVTTREDPEGRPTIFEALPTLKGARWIAIGRLDINTTGLLLLTTDGELANAMMHPSFEVEREYVCRVRAPEGEDVVNEKIVDRLARGVALDDGPAKFDEIERIGGTDSHDWFRVLLKEGRNREVRRLWESQGCQVSRLKRIRYGQVRLPQPLLRGQSQELPQAEVDALRKSVGLEDGTPSALTLHAGPGPAQGQQDRGDRECPQPRLRGRPQHRRRRPRTAPLRQRARGPRPRPWRPAQAGRPDRQRRSRRQAGQQDLQAQGPAPAGPAPAPGRAARREPHRDAHLVRAGRRGHRPQRASQPGRRQPRSEEVRQQAASAGRRLQSGRAARPAPARRPPWPASAGRLQCRHSRTASRRRFQCGCRRRASGARAASVRSSRQCA